MPGSSRGPTSASSSSRRTPTSTVNLSFDQLPRRPDAAAARRGWPTASAPAAFALTTRGESPAGAGIAGSSALNVAVCGALARVSPGQDIDAEALLEIAKNVEAQVIKVPTGLQDYRPAMYGGIAALELRAGTAAARAARRRSARARARIVLCYTGEPRNSGTNNWDITKRHIDGDRHVFDCFERIRDTAAAMREALDARRLGRHRARASPTNGRTASAWRPASPRRRSTI